MKARRSINEKAALDIPATELEVGDIVAEHGAYFEVKHITRAELEGEAVHANMSAWIGGRIVPRYFGPAEKRDWNIQGNSHRMCRVVNRA